MWLSIGVVAIAAGGLAVSTQLHAPAFAQPDARAAQSDAPAVAIVVPDGPADVPADAAAARDARAIVALAPPRDASLDAPRTPALGPRTLDPGWQRDPVWGLDPPIKTEPTVPPRHSQIFEHALVGVTGNDFDPAAWAPVALELARQLEPDARLTGFDVATSPSGHVYWTRDRNARMWFASAAAARAGDSSRLPCIYIFPTRDGIDVHRTDDACTGAGIPLPRCRLADVFGKIQPRDGAKTIDFAYGSKGWRVTQSSGEPTDSNAKELARDDVPDACGP
jgi:hypothetical protein